MTETKTAERAQPEAITAVPVRHPGRWVATVVLAIVAAMFVHMLITNEAFQWRFMIDNMFRPPVIEGVRTTLIVTVLAMIIGVTLGIVIAMMQLSPNPILSGAAWLYTWFFRAVPRIVLLILFGNLGRIDLDTRFFGLDARTILTGFMAGLLGLALSEAAYMAEIVRAGMKAVDPGQQEAAHALGMGRGPTLRRIVLPQAMRVIVPPTGNETIAMLKDTSLLIGIPVGTELFFQLQAIGNRTFQIFPILVAATIYYLIASSVLMVGQAYLERHFGRGFGVQVSADKEEAAKGLAIGT